MKRAVNNNMLLIPIDFKTLGVSPFSATLLALVMYFVYTTGYAQLVFIQFTPLQILSVGLTCLGLLALLTGLFMRPSLLAIRSGPIRLNLKTIATSLFVTFVLIMFTHSGTGFSEYVRTFPLLETELGLGWHQDTVYHVSLIQSILNFGFPSIAQHGHPLTAYHVLSHYVDALILFITQVEPYDSYGLLFHYKIFLFLSSILLAVTAITRNHGWITYLVSFVLLTPCVIGTWHAIGSHGLWMASLIMLLSAPFVFSRILQEDELSRRQLLALFLIIVSIGLAKISSGFMYGAFLGAVILVKQPKAVTTYVFGAALLIFFYLYGNVYYSKLNNITSTLDLSSLGLINLYKFASAKSIGINGIFSYMPTILLWTSILFMLGLIYRKRTIWNLIIGTVLGILALYFITETNKSLGMSDIWYFQYGAYSGLILITFVTIIACKDNLPPPTEVAGQNTKVQNQLMAVVTTVCLALLTKFAVLPDFHVFNTGPESIRQKIANAYTNPFASINSKLAPSDHMSILAKPSTNRARLGKFESVRPLKALREQIVIAQKNNITKNSTALLLSREYFDTAFKPFGGISWARGLLVYAVTGTQLVNGVIEIPGGYGFAPFYANHTALSDQFIAENNICERQSIANTLILFSTAHNGSLIECDR